MTSFSVHNTADGTNEASLAKFSLVQGDAFSRLEQFFRSGVPAASRRWTLALLLAAITWGPAALFALSDNHFWTPNPDASFFHQWAVHIRCLLSIPLLIIAETPAERVAREMLRGFLSNKLIPDFERERFKEALVRSDGLSTARLPWFVMGALIIIVIILRIHGADIDARYTWAVQIASSGREITWAGIWGYEVLYHGASIAAYEMPLAVFIAIVSLLVFLPLLMFAPALMKAKKKAGREYAELLGRYGREVRRRWISKEEATADAELLSAPEIGPVADTIALYETVSRTRIAPIGKYSILGVLVPALAPIIPLLALQISLAKAVLKLVKALF